MNNKKEYDVIVVGSGAGGCTVAREMTRRGKKVLLIEKGGRIEMMGNTITFAMAVDIIALLRNWKDIITLANNYGGLSNLAAGCAIPPPESVFGPIGIDLTEEIEEAKKEMWIQKLPDEIIGKTNLRILEAANSIGYNWQKMDKFIDPNKCTATGDCMMGCKTGAKWTARVYGDEAVKNGADVVLHTKINKPIVENGKVIGVEGRRFGQRVQYHAKAVVLSSGVGNTHILRNAGINEAGKGFCCDWLQFVAGIIPGMNIIKDNPMSVGTMEHYEEGMAIIPVFPDLSVYASILALMGIQHIPKLANFWRYSGIMVKIRDEKAGEIGKGRSFSKSVTETDRKKLDKGIEIIKKVFKAAGAKEDSIFPLKPMGAHPSATCGIGEVVNTDLETRIENLYCCDASVFPASLGTPVVWTAVSLGKRLAKHLDKRI